MLIRKVLAAVGVAAVSSVGFAAAASAAPNFTPNPNSNLSNGDISTLTYSGYPAGQLMYALQCDNNTTNNPNLDITRDCDPLSLNTDSTSDANGSGSIDFSVFVGKPLQPNLKWVCQAASDPVPPGGFTAFSTCYIRLTDNQATNVTDAVFQPITFKPTTTPPVPEAPFTVLLPLGALVVLGGAYFVVRNRRHAAA
jgi:hypothetical protein